MDPDTLLAALESFQAALAAHQKHWNDTNHMGLDATEYEQALRAEESQLRRQYGRLRNELRGLVQTTIRAPMNLGDMDVFDNASSSSDRRFKDRCLTRAIDVLDHAIGQLTSQVEAEVRLEPATPPSLVVAFNHSDGAALAERFVQAQHRFTETETREYTDPTDGSRWTLASFTNEAVGADELWGVVQAAMPDQIEAHLAPMQLYERVFGRQVTRHDVEEAAVEANPQPTNTRAVFVVHGRNGQARRAMFDFLRALGLQPLEWDSLVHETGDGAPSVSTVLDVGFSRAQGVVVLMTPDDEARLRPDLLEPADPTHERELTGQARPNVILEGGMALGRHPGRTILVAMGHLRPMSDLAGMLEIRFDGSEVMRTRLANRLRTIGFDVDMSGTDWLTAGDFPDFAVPVQSDGEAATPSAGEAAQTDQHDLDVAAVISVLMTLDDHQYIDREDLAQRLSLPPQRLNDAVMYIMDYELGEVLKSLGTAPYNFNSIGPTYRTRRFATQNGIAPRPAEATPQAATPSPSASADVALRGSEPDFAIAATNDSDASTRTFWIEFHGGQVEARNVRAVVLTSGQVERLDLAPDWIEQSQRRETVPGARTGPFTITARPMLQMTYENTVGDRFYLAADMKVDGEKVHIMHRTIYYARPDWSWLDPLPEVPLR